MNDCGHQPIIDQLQARLANVEAALQAALARLAELEPPPAAAPTAPAFTPKPNQRQSPKQRRKRDPHHNHTRRLCPLPTGTVDHAFDFCPQCVYRLHGSTLSYQRELIDLPPPQPAVVELHRFISRYCPCCEQTCTPAANEMLADRLCGQSRFGNRLRSVVGLLLTKLRLPVEQVQLYLHELHGLSISAGGVVLLAAQLSPRRPLATR